MAGIKTVNPLPVLNMPRLSDSSLVRLKEQHWPAVFFVLLLIGLLHPVAPEAAGSSLSSGQTVYIPAYSHIYHGNKASPLLLSVTLSIRNIDPERTMTLTMVDYHESQGTFLKKYISQPLALGPLASVQFIVPERDDSGGAGANFIVKWHGDKPMNPPIMETVMIGTQSQLGISFTSRGQPIE